MPLNIEDALRDGFDRATANSGLTVAGAFFIFGLANAIAASAAFRYGMTNTGMPGMMANPQPVPFVLPPAVAGLVSLVAWIATIVLTIGAIRIFVRGIREDIPGDVFTESIVWPGVNYVIGSIVFAVVVGIGFILLIIPGVFLLVSLVFWTVYVAEEHDNFYEAFQRSWALAKGDRWMIFGVGFALAVIAIVVSGVFGIVGLLIPGLFGLLVAQVGNALITTYSLAVLAAVYLQLVESEAAEADGDDADPLAA